jgi:hypothetical protein
LSPLVGTSRAYGRAPQPDCAARLPAETYLKAELGRLAYRRVVHIVVHVRLHGERRGGSVRRKS